jgi:hypothetical protein
MRYVLIVLFASVLVGCDIPSADDQAEASKIVDGMVARYHFRVMCAHENRPAVYELPHVHYSEILVFGDYSTTEQDEILKTAHVVRREVATKPVLVRFYPKENVEENLIRQEKIE